MKTIIEESFIFIRYVVLVCDDVQSCSGDSLKFKLDFHSQVHSMVNSVCSVDRNGRNFLNN